MKQRFSTALLCTAAAVAIAFGGCGGGKPRLNGAGATFVYPMMSKWAAEYNKAKSVEVNYQSIGSGGGIQQMTAKTADFGCTDGPMNDEQLKKAREVGGEVIHIPLVMGAVVPAYNVEGVKQQLTFSGPLLADIFLGKVKKWNDKTIQELNPGAMLPDKEIAVVHRSDGSGTTYVWVDYLAKVSPEWQKKVGVATSVEWPAGEGAKGNEGVSGRVKAAPGALGYIELTYALQNQITFGLVKNKEGVAIKAELKSITAAADNSLKQNPPEDLRYSITDAPGKDSYPISGTTWAVIYVNQPSAKGQHIVNFLRWVTHEGQQFCEGLDYAKLPPDLVQRLEKRLELVKMK
jgi:phosphate ABC transporter phosphate-binding protein